MTLRRRAGDRIRLRVRRGLAAAVLVAAASSACDRPEPEPTGDPGPPEAAPTAPAPGEIDRLRALGYLDFSDETVEADAAVVPVYDPELSWPGVNLFVTRALCLAELIDARGNVLRAWKHRPGRAWSNAELTPEGDLLVQGLHRGRSLLLRLSWEGEIVWQRAVGAHHDVEVTPDGRIAALVQRRRVIPEVDPGRPTLDHGIAILDPDGRLLREHSLYEMLSAAPEVFRFQPVAPAGGKVDLLHANSVEHMRHDHLAARHPLYASRNAVVSMRHQDAIAIFDLETEEVVWSWGQGEIFGPHDATVLPSGNLLLFDNGLGRGWSRVVELDPLTKTIVWEYRAPEPTDFYTAGRGSSQRLPNGNTLIANSDSGEAFEVTPEGEVVWRFLNPHANLLGRRATIVRMRRYPEAFIAEIARRRGSGRGAMAPQGGDRRTP